MFSSLSFLKKLVVSPVSEESDVFAGCLCPKCKDVYVLGYFFIHDEYEDEECSGHEYYISDEPATCINCGQGDLSRPLLFLTAKEAENYINEHDTETFFKVRDNQCGVWRMTSQMYMDRQRQHTMQ